MITLRPARERGHFDFGWLDTWHSFSFGNYHDPRYLQFRALRVINEDRIAPGQGFGMHGHQDMEILTWVLAGSLEHRDSLGSRGRIGPGEAQVMSAGTGIRHSEFNASADEDLHLLQIWLLPEALGLPPRYGQIAFQDSELRNRWLTLAGPAGTGAALELCQDARILASRLDADTTLQRELAGNRHGWLQVARGRVELHGLALEAGDGVALSHEPALTLTALDAAEVLFFDLG